MGEEDKERETETKSITVTGKTATFQAFRTGQDPRRELDPPRSVMRRRGEKTCGVEQAERITSGLDDTEPPLSKFDREEETWQRGRLAYYLLVRANAKYSVPRKLHPDVTSRLPCVISRGNGSGHTVNNKAA